MESSFSRHAGVLAYGYCVFMGVLTEVAQQLTKARTPEYRDFLANLAGAALAFGIYGLTHLRHYRRTGVARSAA